MEQLKILVVDDEARMRKLVKDFLSVKGFTVLEASNGEEAVDLFFEQKDIALIILDVMMPKMDGWETCRTIRKYSQVPIIMLTAKTEEADLIKGLEMGADDYIYKPFSPRAVVAKVGAVLRRTESDELINVPISYNQGKLVIDFDNMSVTVRGEKAGLTPTEFKILVTMAKAPNRIFTREQLITYALDDDFDGYDRSIDTYIKGIRAKIEEDRRDPSYILTVHGMGYKFAGEKE